ncbi:LysR family transcriptional regulator [Pigmentiphaga aceris]|uniref:LysR family transcriptional regulator n=1 Tax=Pigmentiphaga aceris TaxID=1940612 RepID=A0A5C0B6I6_9BURK|nr:LysR substrate-binding domain-containing protein [Pigmentiphaga aceris]QEI08227.1 LysR family transcriptional regulator [Pigmentiphaga aceris]
MLNRISLRQMEYFVATAKHGSIAAASAQIHISSPSISAAIAHIEIELGVQLFVRHPSKGLGLTATGTLVLRQCEEVLETSSRLYDIASDSSNAIQGALRVGSFQSLTAMIAPEVIFGFARAFEKVDVQMLEGDQEVLMSKLHALEIDLAITYDLHLGDDIHFERLATLPPYVLVSELHPLAEQSAVTLEELAPQPFVLLDLPMSRDYFTSLFSQAGVTPNIVARSRSEEVVRSMVANGFGYAIFNVRPKSNMSLDGKRLVRVRLAGSNRPMLLGLATYKSMKASRLTSVFMERCRAYISDQYIPGMSAASFYDPRMLSS